MRSARYRAGRFFNCRFDDLAGLLLYNLPGTNQIGEVRKIGNKEESGMKYTSAEAGKLVKKLEERIRDLKDKEERSSVFNAASTEDSESLRPEYDFAATQEQIRKLQADVRNVKHAINIFNTTHELPGFEGLTIDQALILIPQLSQEKEKMRRMAGRLPKQRVVSLMSRSNIIDYEITNYDLEAAKEAYQEVADRLAAIQLALDAVNTSEAMEIAVKL